MNARAKAWIGSGIFLLLAPGIVAGVVPYLLTGWRGADWGRAGLAISVIAAVLILSGVVFLLQAFVRFAADGLGTPAPVAPTEHLVMTGVYRWVRNPMYLAVWSIILGQGLLFASVPLLVYLLAAATAMVLFVKLYEEPTLERKYGDEYREYRQQVPGWLPRRPRN
jgi:protein-S-isoprenylcysteine O-methyltransferase Ste14